MDWDYGSPPEAWPSDGTARVVAERKPWLADGLRETLRKDRNRIFIQLCGVPMAANQAALFMALASEGLQREQHKADAEENMCRLNSGSTD